MVERLCCAEWLLRLRLDLMDTREMLLVDWGLCTYTRATTTMLVTFLPRVCMSVIVTKWALGDTCCSRNYHKDRNLAYICWWWWSVLTLYRCVVEIKMKTMFEDVCGPRKALDVGGWEGAISLPTPGPFCWNKMVVVFTLNLVQK